MTRCEALNLILPHDHTTRADGGFYYRGGYLWLAILAILAYGVLDTLRLW
jgi:hypothetical protein